MPGERRKREEGTSTRCYLHWIVGPQCPGTAKVVHPKPFYAFHGGPGAKGDDVGREDPEMKRKRGCFLSESRRPELI